MRLLVGIILTFLSVFTGNASGSYSQEGDLIIVGSKALSHIGLNQPSAVAINSSGEQYLLDGKNNRVIVFSKEGEFLSTFREQGERSSEQHSMGIALTEEGRVIVADTANARLAIYTEKGRFVRVISLIDDLLEKPAEPSSLMVQHDVVTWSDRAHHRLCQNRISSGKSLGCFGTFGNFEGEFQYPFMIAIDHERYLHVVDVLNSRVQVFNQRGRYSSQYGGFGTTPGTLYRPNGVALDERGYVYITDSYFGTISVFYNGRFISYLKDSSGALIQFMAPVGIAYHDQQLVVVDSLKNELVQLDIQFVDRVDSGQRHDTKPLKKNTAKGCVSCHLSWSKDKNALALVSEDDGVPPVSSSRMCYSCHHGAVFDSRSALDMKHQHTTVYNPEIREELQNREGGRKEPIPTGFPLSSQNALMCSSCHTPHNSDKNHAVLYQGHANSWMRSNNSDSANCEACHESKTAGAYPGDMSELGKNHPLGIRFKPPLSSDNIRFVKDQALQRGLPLVLKKSAAALGESDQLVCQTCHQIHGGKDKDLLVLANEDSSLCISCHQSLFTESLEAARKKGLHPVNETLTNAVIHNGERVQRVTCITCHSAHNNRSGTAALTNGTKDDAKRQCGSCHESYFVKSRVQSLREGKHQTNLELGSPVSIGGEDISKVNCFTCHSVHGGKPNSASLVMEDIEGQLCMSCHEEQRMVLNSDHDLRDLESKANSTQSHASVCENCHSMHGSQGKLPYLFSRDIDGDRIIPPDSDQPLFKRDQLCLECHLKGGLADEKSVEHFSHPYRDLVLRSDPEIMPLLKLEENSGGIEEEVIHDFGAIACITCHNPHQWEAGATSDSVSVTKTKKNREGTSKDSFLRRKSIKGSFCINCHGIEALPKYKYYHHTENGRDVGASYLK